MELAIQKEMTKTTLHFCISIVTIFLILLFTLYFPHNWNHFSLRQQALDNVDLYGESQDHLFLHSDDKLRQEIQRFLATTQELMPSLQSPPNITEIIESHKLYIREKLRPVRGQSDYSQYISRILQNHHHNTHNSHNSLERNHSVAWHELKEVDGLKNTEVAVFVMSTGKRHNAFLWQRIIPSYRTWLQYFANALVVVEGTSLKFSL